MTIKKLFIEILGWYGVVAVITAYLLNSFAVVATHSVIYQLLNLSGAIGIIVEAANRKDPQPVVLNIIWASIAIIAITSILLQ